MGVPLIVRVPGVTRAGARCRTAVSQVQIVASCSIFAGSPVPAGLDGESFARDLREPGSTRETSVFAE